MTPIISVLPATGAGTLFTTGNIGLTGSLAGLRLSTGPAKVTVSDVQAQLPLVGFIERSASVAEHLQEPPAVGSQRFALEGKRVVHESLFDLMRLQDRTDLPGKQGRSGIAVADLLVPGFALKAGVTPGPDRAPGTLGDLFTHGDDYDDIDVLPDASGRHEADYFSAAVKALDNAIALMRLVEGRIALYNSIFSDAQSVQGTLTSNAADADARLRTMKWRAGRSAP